MSLDRAIENLVSKLRADGSHLALSAADAIHELSVQMEAIRKSRDEAHAARQATMESGEIFWAAAASLQEQLSAQSDARLEVGRLTELVELMRPVVEAAELLVPEYRDQSGSNQSGRRASCAMQSDLPSRGHVPQ